MLCLFNLRRFCVDDGVDPRQTEGIEPELVQKFFKHVAKGEQAQTEAMLEQIPELLVSKGSFNDLEGRDFTDIDPDIARLGNHGQRLFQGTAFQYALLALDRPMWLMLQNYLEQYSKHYPNELRKQASLFLEDDWIKRQNSNSEVHMQRLIDVLQTYIDGHEKWTKEERENYWCKKVGAAELLLPMNIFHEICCPQRPFAPKIPNFNCDIPSRSSKFISSDDAAEYDNIFAFFVAGQWARLGIDHALTRSGGPPIAVCRDGKPGATHFRTALQSLLETRLEQRKMLLESLGPFYNREATSSSEGGTPRSDSDTPRSLTPRSARSNDAEEDRLLKPRSSKHSSAC